MSCPTEDEILDLVAGQLGAPRTRMLHAHLDACGKCREVVAELVRLEQPQTAIPDSSDDAHATHRMSPAQHAPTHADRPPNEALDALQPGAVLRERYRLERFVGEGGLGVVWAATDLVMLRPIAAKLLRWRAPGLVDRFLREARITAALRHPNIVEVHDAFELLDGTPALLMELLEGESLRDRLAREVRLPCDETAAIGVRVAAALGNAHVAGVVHRDVKPGNIFVHGARDRLSVKVLDFGLAKLTAIEGGITKTRSLTAEGTVLGTPHYMSPEQMFGERSIDHRADVWALGVVLYECLAGERPFRGKNFGQLFRAITAESAPAIATRVPTLPPELAALVDSMLARDRERRPADLRRVYDVLARYAR